MQRLPRRRGQSLDANNGGGGFRYTGGFFRDPIKTKPRWHSDFPSDDYFD